MKRSGLSRIRPSFTELDNSIKGPLIAILGVLTLAAIFMAGYVNGSSNVEKAVDRALADKVIHITKPPTPPVAPPSRDCDIAPAYACDADDKGAYDESEPGIIVMLSPVKAALELPGGYASEDCEQSDGYQTLYRACVTHTADDPEIEKVVERLLTTAQRQFITDNAAKDATWAFNVKEMPALTSAVAQPTALPDDDGRILVYVW